METKVELQKSKVYRWVQGQQLQTAKTKTDAEMTVHGLDGGSN
jgi:hypothetical protein